MKKLCTLFILFTLICNRIQAQDLIVTSDGDSLNCRITKQNAQFVYFTFAKDGQPGNTLLPASKVSSVKKAFYGSSQLPEGMQPLSGKSYSQWQFGIRAGYAYRTAKVSDQVSSQYKDYIKKLKSGFVLGGDLHYFISEPLGFGLKYSFNKHKHDDGTDLKDDISMHYIAASMLNRYILANPKSSILLGINLGYQSYKDKTVLMGTALDMTGGTAGFGLDAGFTHQLSAGTAVHFGLSYTTATLYNINVGQGSNKQKIKLEKGQYEGLSRLELTAGFRFGK
ncbi:porin family protein [Dyadobacter flavalbus]|uniref:Porin family protein n=1 Tax=Dyadobacter flavalbus TaxID=2579942 RepID=A0A5M8QQU7_9BACT|nr:outer membrane beta-barrel protein [Dyadobacter flavalbus]KAA6437006.1 porin family protein [Dyadobacter flavalbus]